MFIFHGEVIDYTWAHTQNNLDCVVFLHGWGGNKNSFNSTFNLLKTKHNCLSLTLPTIAPTNLVWTMWDYAYCVRALIESLGVEKIDIVCHSFGFRVATILSKVLTIKRMVVTGGAGPKKICKFKKIEQNNAICTLKLNKNKNLFKNFASADYLNLAPINKMTFKSVVNFNTLNLLKFNFPLVLFWGKRDTETPIWIAKKLKKINPTATLEITNGDHFAYLKQNALFNNLVVRFLT